MKIGESGGSEYGKSTFWGPFLPLGDGYCHHSTVCRRCPHRHRRRVKVIPALRVPCVNSATFFDVSSIIVGISRGIFFCLAQF